eukprot:CAMPEP_0197891148 /NCGR_PEP_ID=MMETSP1439-20131203/27404_1 /TAXON_ID=66791 /ORGANISM="Gonyaulax spinifera, Strain CCMP409" /LENGTH=42 /DNA_ID= /DNA_START= /DNA_END= /DNA_ORIENTATION=
MRTACGHPPLDGQAISLHLECTTTGRWQQDGNHWATLFEMDN